MEGEKPQTVPIKPVALWGLKACKEPQQPQLLSPPNPRVLNYMWWGFGEEAEGASTGQIGGKIVPGVAGLSSQKHKAD